MTELEQAAERWRTEGYPKSPDKESLVNWNSRLAQAADAICLANIAADFLDTTPITEDVLRASGFENIDGSPWWTWKKFRVEESGAIAMAGNQSIPCRTLGHLRMYGHVFGFEVKAPEAKEPTE